MTARCHEASEPVTCSTALAVRHLSTRGHGGRKCKVSGSINLTQRHGQTLPSSPEPPPHHQHLICPLFRHVGGTHKKVQSTADSLHSSSFNVRSEHLGERGGRQRERVGLSSFTFRLGGESSVDSVRVVYADRNGRWLMVGRMASTNTAQAPTVSVVRRGSPYPTALCVDVRTLWATAVDHSHG